MSIMPVSAADPSPPRPSKPRRLIRETGFTTLADPPAPLADVVFLHGLQGSPRTTWTYSGAGTEGNYHSSTRRVLRLFKKKKSSQKEEELVTFGVFWLADLLPDDRNDVRLMTYGYDSQVTKFFQGPSSQLNISEHGRSFLNTLTFERPHCRHRPLILVAHSLGGLIIKEALRRSRDERHHEHLKDVYRSTFATIFFGTPHRGLGDAGWGEIFRRIASAAQFDTTKSILSDLDPSSGSAKLDELSEAFSDMLDQQGFQVYSFQESQGKVGVRPLRRQVVPKESSALNERKHEIKESINANHMEMCRLKGREDDGYQKFLGALNLFVKQIHEKQLQTMEANANRPELVLTDPVTTSMLTLNATVILPYTGNPNFVGHSDILEELKTRFGLDYQKGRVKSQVRAALFGLGGVGKTQIALAYAYWVQEKCPNVSLFWVHASSIERFLQAFAQIAQTCQIPGHDEPQANVPMLVKDWLERKVEQPWLMIIDNADNTEIFFNVNRNTLQHVGHCNRLASEDKLARYVPQCSHGHILINTRNKETGVRLLGGPRPIEVEKMTRTESNQLICRRLEDEALDLDQVARLADCLENLPLALTQAAAFIQEKSLTIEGYHQLLEESDDHLLELLGEPFEDFGRDSDIPNAVAATWMISFKQIREQYPLANDLLSLMAFLDRQGIPKLFLLYYCRQVYDQDDHHGNGAESRLSIDLERALGILKAFSFISEGRRDGSLNSHHLIQLVMRKWLVTQRISSQWARKALSIVAHFYPRNAYENWEKCQEYLPHAYAVLRHVNSPCTTDYAEVQGSLLLEMGSFMLDRGKWSTAEKLFLRAIDIVGEAMGDGTGPIVISAMSNLAITYRYQGRWKEAEGLQRSLMKTRKESLGEKHPDTLVSMHNLAGTCQEQGQWKEAEGLQLFVMKTSEKVLSEKHPATLSAMHNLAWIYQGQGRWREAEELQLLVMEIRKKVLGEKHPDTLLTISDLARTYQNQGRWKEAEESQLFMINARKKTLGEKHPGTLMTMSYLAGTYQKQGRYKVAEELQTFALKISKEVLGEKHPHTLAVISSLARIWYGQARRKEAFELLASCVKLSDETLGTNHPQSRDRKILLDMWIQE